MKTQRKAISNKVRSTRGASLSLALLLFLICSVLGAVVLTAGSASAGRVADMAEMDRRYYNVSSAAELLGGELGGKTVRIERTRETVTTVVTTGIVSGEAGNETVAETKTTTETVTYSTLVVNTPE